MTKIIFKVMMALNNTKKEMDMSFMIKEYSFSDQFTIINANDITAADQKRLITDYQITHETINYALDNLERPRITFNELTQSYLMVIAIPSFHDELENMIQSVTLVANKQHIICFTTHYSQHVMKYISRFFNQNNNSQNIILELFAYLIQEISKEFLDVLKVFYDQQEKIEVEFHKRSRRATTITTLAELQSKITFGLTSASGNDDLIDQVKNIFRLPNQSRKINHHTRKQLEAAQIEANQVLKNFQLLNEIVQQLSGTYNNILNNETNDVMRYLTVYSLILTIPTIVVGFYGMNMHLPLAHGSWAWLYALIITIVLTIILIIDMIRRHFL